MQKLCGTLHIQIFNVKAFLARSVKVRTLLASAKAVSIKHVTSHIGRGANAYSTCHGNSLHVLCSTATTCSPVQLHFLGGFSTSSWHHYSNSRRMLHSITAAAM